jgi:hypothetical protein
LEDRGGGVKNPEYLRVRAALCETHGLGGFTRRAGRDDPGLLDEYAAQIVQTVLKAKAKKKKAA